MYYQNEFNIKVLEFKLKILRSKLKSNNVESQKHFNEKVLNFKREILRKQLKKCSKTQKEMFKRMYKSIDDINEDRMVWAYYQIMQTLSPWKS